MTLTSTARKWIIGGVVAVLLAGIGTAAYQYRHAIQDAARQAIISEELRQEVKELQEQSEELRQRNEELYRIIEQRGERIREIEQREREHRQEVELGEWGERPVPDDVVERLRDQPGTGGDD